MRSASGAPISLRVRLSRRYCAALSVRVSMRLSYRIGGAPAAAGATGSRWSALPARAAGLLLGEAVAAVDGPVLPGQERDLCGGAAAGAGGVVHLAGGITAAAASVATATATAA